MSSTAGGRQAGPTGGLDLNQIQKPGSREKSSAVHDLTSLRLFPKNHFQKV
jgi:hypothetical protein